MASLGQAFGVLREGTGEGDGVLPGRRQQPPNLKSL
jgi:hypothetical protein